MTAPYIRRLDRHNNATHGWEVHVARRDLRASRMFSDTRYGGSEGALAAAIAWRDAQEWYRNGDVLNRRSRLTRADAFVTAVLLEHEMRGAPEGDPPPAAEPGVSRIEGDEGTRPGWMASAPRDRRETHKFFADRDWGDMHLAHAAATVWRQIHIGGRDAVAELKAPRKFMPAPAAVKSVGRGIAEPPVRYEKTQLGDGRRGQFAFWMVAVTDGNGHRLERKFSVNYWGEDIARRKAEAVHRQNLQWADLSDSGTAPRTTPAGQGGSQTGLDHYTEQPMAYSSILGADPAPQQPGGRDSGALGPSDNSDSGSDTIGTHEAHADSDARGTGERAAVAGPDLKEGGDIMPDRVVQLADGEGFPEADPDTQEFTDLDADSEGNFIDADADADADAEATEERGR
ncbi:hypothetical protein [Ramlibacter albus]|uniref:hypothetical protein n=1 Tax=Ramlibacter albus TaxID=2079448 RepID=UPI00210765B5|nr:hypothetical protein [Ramlibacter albus]